MKLLPALAALLTYIPKEGGDVKPLNFWVTGSGGGTTITYRRGDNVILEERIFEKTPGESITHAYDLTYLGQIYTSYLIGPKSREKATYNARMENQLLLKKQAQGTTQMLGAGSVKAIDKKLAALPSHFSWIDSDGDGQDDRFYFTQYDDETHRWRLLEAYAIATDGTVTPAPAKVLQEWSDEYAARANN
jgi:hypothetical protein